MRGSKKSGKDYKFLKKLEIGDDLAAAIEKTAKWAETSLVNAAGSEGEVPIGGRCRMHRVAPSVTEPSMPCILQGDTNGGSAPDRDPNR